MTRSGRAAIICVALAVHESAKMVGDRDTISGTTSSQYFVHATTRSSSPSSARITVALGCRQAMRLGVWEGMIQVRSQSNATRQEERPVLTVPHESRPEAARRRRYS